MLSNWRGQKEAASLLQNPYSDFTEVINPKAQKLNPKT